MPPEANSVDQSDNRLFIRPYLPDEQAAGAFIQGEYSAWFLGHPTSEELCDEVLQAHHNAWLKTLDPDEDTDGEEAELFCHYLEAHGYTTLLSGPEGCFCPE